MSFLRPDVAEHYNEPSYDNSGFQARIPLAELDGMDEFGITVVIVDGDEISKLWLGDGFSIEVGSQR